MYANFSGRKFIKKKSHSNMKWSTGIVLILSVISFSGALLQGHSNATASSNEHTDLDVYKQLLHLETNLVSVFTELTTLKEQNLQQQKTSEQQQELIQTLNQTIQNLKSENGVLKDKLDRLNSTICQQNYSDGEIAKKLEPQIQTLSLAILELNKSSSEDFQTLRNIFRSREQEVSKNMTSVVSSLKLNDRYLSLSLLDVQNNISALGSLLQQQQKTQAEQHKLTQARIQNLTFSFNNSTAITQAGIQNLTFSFNNSTAITQAGIQNLTFSFNNSTAITQAGIQNLTFSFNNSTAITQAGIQNLTFSFNNSTAITQAGIQNLTFSFNNSTAELRSSLSDLQTRIETTVAFTAGVGDGDNRVFSSGQTVIFRQIIYQVGGGYNPLTGIFTAPNAGLYLLFCTSVAFHDEIFWTKIMINGSVKAGVMAYHPSSNMYVYQSASNLVVQQLQVRDRVWIQVYQGSHLYSEFPDTTFSVIMINGSF